jgi:hypothetical protein
MAIIRIIRPPMLTADVYEAVNARAEVNENPPEGLLIHTAGEVDGEWQIVDVWQSAEHARRFDEERLAPAIAAVVGSAPPGPPPRSVYELHRVIRP